MKPKILAFAGSAREGSWNKLALAVAAQGAEAAGAEVTRVDLRDHPLPLFDQDLESAEGAPEQATKLKELFFAHQGLLIASPEYNSSISPLLKNAIDWVSRPAEGEAMCAAYQGKVVGLLSASPGGLGGLRGLVHLRSILGSIGCVVLPKQYALGRAFEAFDEQGQPKEERARESLEGVGRELAEFLARLG